MTTLALTRLAISVGVAALLLNACGGSSAAIDVPGGMPQIHAIAKHGVNEASAQDTATSCSKDHSRLSDAARNEEPLVYISDSDRIQIVPERPHNGRRVGRITDGISGAQGLWVDRNGSLYVANGRAGTITVYPRGCVTPSITYTGLPGPKYIVVDDAGNVFVSNSDGTVTEFLPGVTSLARTWKTPGTQADGITLDNRGNVYVAFRGGRVGQGNVEEFRKAESIDVFPAGSEEIGKVISVPDIPTELVVTANEEHLFVVGYFAVWAGVAGMALSNGQAF